jgi:hypothetical protein
MLLVTDSSHSSHRPNIPTPIHIPEPSVWSCGLWRALAVVLQYWVWDDGGEKGNVNVGGPVSVNGAANECACMEAETSMSWTT